MIARELDPADPNGTQVRVQAGRKAIRRQNRLLSQGAHFAVETTLSGNRELAWLHRTKEAGYKVNLIYIGVGSPTTAYNRVVQRRGAGGHEVPLEDIRRRYARSIG